MRFIFSILLVIAICCGLSECFGAGLKQMMMQSRGGPQAAMGGYGKYGGYGAGAGTVNLAGGSIGTGANARSYKNFYAQAYDENGYPRQMTASPQAFASLAGMNFGGNGYSGYNAIGRRR